VYRNNKNIAMVHGGWNNPIDEYFAPSQDYFSKIDGHFFASGHTHKQMIMELGEKIYCNPGSVGQPRDGNSKSAFATFDGDHFALHRIEYDIEKVGLLMEQSGFSKYHYDRLKTGAPHFII